MTEPLFLQKTRAAYDMVAADYAELLRDLLADSTWDRAVLDAFAELVRADGGGRVGDLGCGPGRITTYLHSLGLDVFGVDLSPAMISIARQLYPELRFEVGSITALDLADGALGGALAWYSTIHTRPEQLPTVFGEFARVLRPGGYLLLAFQVGDEHIQRTQAYGHAVSFDAYRRQPDQVAAELTRLGFVVQAQLIRAPGDREATDQAYLIARK